MAILVFGIAALESTPPAFAQMGPSPVAVSEVVQREVSSGQTFVGTVMPLKKSIIGSAVDGRVVEFPVNAGDRVYQRQPLAQLLTETIRLQLEAARAQLQLYQSELEELQNGTRPEEIDEAKARMTGAKARVDYAKARYNRARTLLEQGRAVSEEHVEEALAASIEAEQSYLQLKAAYELAVQGPRKEKILQAQARVAMQTAEADRIADQMKKHTMFSPFDGYVTAEHTEVGQWVNKGDPVAEVVALDEVDIEASVLEAHIPHVTVGMSARVEIPSLPREAFTGHVALIVPQAEVRSRTIPVKVRLKNVIEEDIPLVKAGMLARVTLPTGATESALLVPKDALVLGGPRPIVYVVDPDSKQSRQGNTRPVPVELGVASGRLIQVRGELKPGQQVVVQGNERLRPGQQVIVNRVIPTEPAPLVPEATTQTTK